MAELPGTSTTRKVDRFPVTTISQEARPLLVRTRREPSGAEKLSIYKLQEYSANKDK